MQVLIKCIGIKELISKVRFPMMTYYTNINERFVVVLKKSCNKNHQRLNTSSSLITIVSFDTSNKAAL